MGCWWGQSGPVGRTDGPRALLRGLLPRMLLQGPASAATFVCFEAVLRASRISDEASVE